MSFRFRISVLLLLIFSIAKTQENKQEDSLWAAYNSASDKGKAVLTLIRISETCYKRDRELSEKLAQRAVDEAKKTGNKVIKAKAVSRLTNTYFDNGKYEESYYVADELLTLAEEIKDNSIYADACKIIGRRYHFRGEYDKALEFYLKGLTYFEKDNNTKQMSEIYNSMGGVYLNQEDNKKAYDFYHKAQEIQFRLKSDNGIARGYLNMANALIATKNNVKAKVFLDSAYFYYDRINSDEGKGYVYSTVSNIYVDQGQIDSALSKLMISRKIMDKLNKFYTLSQVDLGIADLYVKKNDLKNAIKFVDSGIEVARKTKQSHNIAPLYSLKAVILEKMGKVAEAFENYKLYKAFSDTVLNAKTIRKQTEDALKYDYSKKEYQQEIEKQKMLAEQKDKETRQRFILNATLVGVIFLLIILFLVARSYRSKQKTSKIIAQQKLEVEKQHHLLQEKNKEVLDSILYAKRLQQAILPSEENIKKHLPESFVLYKPKDIVAGDFYWMHTTESYSLEVKGSERITNNPELILIAAADCTGHGVPGALVSVVCSNALNRSVLEFGLSDPAKILDKTRELVIATFEKSDKEVKDGMDISLLSIQDKSQKSKERTLSWAGANNPLWIINPKGEIKEIKADKQPIGKYDAEAPFTSHEIKVEKGDRIFMFTDGFADQFGGLKGKKFKYKQLQQILVESMNSSIDQQKEILDKKFSDWKGDLEQVDDVCVIGIQL
ncbi:MAG: protein serine/threonine phosphatase [Bacteroidetes bacterium]|jgi:serine phosphatase RsbU (regulator of sigma subunit)|nr:protein serine/threonine phosphatase [Bacteroidota bacterium]